jgi:endoglucanase
MCKRKIFLTLILLSLIVLSTELDAQGFLHRENKKIVDGSGQEILLKGIGLGGWLLQEGYMLHTSSFANAQWEIKAKIEDLIGETNTAIFYEAYRDNYVRKIDIDSIKSWGFNSIRLPFHYDLFATNTNPPVFLNKGFEILDSLLSWCEANQIYLILDMHAAPGGQSDEPISDYNPAYPSLWQSEQNKNLTVQIWRKIAEHYKDEEWIGGYDLLNEPKWNLPPGNLPLRDLYIRITDTIRAVDKNHLIFIEGNWFATDFAGLTPAWDDNMAYSFHKYWNGNTQSSIQYLVDLRNSANRPLWLGETGENSNKWFVDCVELMKSNNIGWAWWPHKKIESIAGPLSAYISAAYQTLLNYWNGTAPKPNPTYAFNALMDQVNLLLLENCKYQKDVIDAIMRQPYDSNVIPFANNQIPGIIHSTNYDLGKIGNAYKDTDYENVGSNGVWNRGYSYRNDGVDIERCNDLQSNGYNVGWISSEEWLKFTVNVDNSGLYDINLNVASPNTGGKMRIYSDNQILTNDIDIPNTGGWQNWQYVMVKNVFLPAGNHTLHTRFLIGGYNFSYMEFVLVTADVQEELNYSLSFNLEQNYPNPFNSTTVINYSIASASDVTIKIYDVLGNEVEILLDELKQSGNYSIQFSSEKLPSGVYICTMNAGSFSSSKKIIILK